MAGHSQFANIKHRKGAQDKKRGKIFTRVTREIMVAARSGLPDPESNARLRAAIYAARAVNMPKDNIQRAIDKATGAGEGAGMEEIRYEGYASGGVAVIVECVTDNKNRTAGEVRSLFTKHGGNMGAHGSVSFMFDHIGYVRYPKSAGEGDKMLELAIEAGAENVESSDEYHLFTCKPDDLGAVRDVLTEKLGDPEESGFDWRAKTMTPVSGDVADTLSELIDALEELDDVQYVATNAG